MKAYTGTVAMQRDGTAQLGGERPHASIGDALTVVTRGAPLCDQVHAALFDSLTSGCLRPGDRVVEREWAERLEVSRTPVRQAIQRLAQEGLLEPMRSGGYAVSRPRIDDISQLYEFRAVIERHTAEAAAGRVRVAALSRNLEGAQTALAHRDAEGWTNANAAFHRIIAEACQQRHFARVVDTALRWAAFYQQALWAGPAGATDRERQALRRMEQSVRDHHVIAGCLATGDATAAGQAMVRHLRRMGEQLPPRAATAAGRSGPGLRGR